jgi:hypothetical protein
MIRFNTDINNLEYYNGSSWVPAGAQTQIITSGLIFNFDATNSSSYPGSGSTWYDISGSNYTGTLNNTTYNINPGEIVFNGSNSNVNTTMDISWNNTNSVSATFVLKPASLTPYQTGIAGKLYPDWEWAFYQENDSLKMVYWNSGGGHTNGMDWTASNFFTSTSSYVIFQYVWNGSTSYVYRNGSLVTTQTAVNASINQNRSNTMQLGGNIYVWSNNYWSGSIPVVQFYNRALSGTEITQNYNALKNRFGV